MRRDHKIKILILFLIIAVLSILLPTAFGDPRIIKDQCCGSAFRNFVYDFQTLITGILAVGAATWTVLTMDRTDRKSDIRHHQLIALQLRADGLRVERMVFPNLMDLLKERESLKAIDINEVKVFAKNSNLTSLQALLEPIIPTCAAIRMIFERKCFNESRDLLSARMTNSLENIIDVLRVVAHQKNVVTSTWGNFGYELRKNGNVKDAEEYLIAAVNSLNNTIETIGSNVDNFCTGLMAMQREHSIHREALKPSPDRW